MKNLILLFLTCAAVLGQSRPMYYDNATRNVAPTDLDYVGATANFTSSLQLNSVNVATVNQATWFSGGSASETWTFNLSAGDPVITFGNGVVNVSSGTLQQGGTAVVLTSRTLTVAGTANEITSSAGAQDLSGNRIWTLSLPAALTFTGKTVTGGTFSSPTLGTPTFTGSWTMPDNTRQTFNPGANAAGINVGSHAGDPDTPSNGDLWYSTSANALRAWINGGVVSLGAGGGGGTPGGSDTQVQYNDGGSFGGANVTINQLTNIRAGTVTGTNAVYAGTFIGTGATADTSVQLPDDDGDFGLQIQANDTMSANVNIIFPAAPFTGVPTFTPTGSNMVMSAANPTKQLNLQRPDYGDGIGAVPQTNNYTASGLMHYTLSGNAETNGNYIVYEFDCPSDLDTSVEMTARFAFLSGGTDADDYVFHLTYGQVAPGTAYPTGTSISSLPIVMTVTPTTAANGDLQSSGAVTLTGWAAALTPGRAMLLRIARLQNSQDDGARDVQLVISYGSTL